MIHQYETFKLKQYQSSLEYNWVVKQTRRVWLGKTLNCILNVQYCTASTGREGGGRGGKLPNAFQIGPRTRIERCRSRIERYVLITKRRADCRDRTWCSAMKDATRLLLLLIIMMMTTSTKMIVRSGRSATACLHLMSFIVICVSATKHGQSFWDYHIAVTSNSL